MLAEMEKKLSNIYARAQREVDKKTKTYWQSFEKKDKEKKKLFTAGKITEREYKSWRKAQLFTGNRWNAMRSTVSNELINAGKTAMSYVNGNLPEIYALNYNALKNKTVGIKGYSFTMVDAATVKNLAMNDKTLLPYKTIDGKKFERWNTKKVNSEVLQGIIQGESIPDIAKRLEKVTDMNEASAIRNARTSVTGAENKGRLDSYKAAEEMGIVLKKEWLCMHDSRTRDWHRELDGVQVELDEPFENSYGKIMYPGDPHAEPGNVYNCRCTMVSAIKGISEERKAYNSIMQGNHASDEFIRESDNLDLTKVISLAGGATKEEAERYIQAVRAFVGNEHTAIRKYQQHLLTGHEKAYVSGNAKAIEKFIQISPKWRGGNTYRAIGASDETIERLYRREKEDKPINMLGTASWTTDKDYAKERDVTGKRVIFVSPTQSKGTSIKLYSQTPAEEEVLVSKDAKYLITDIKEVKDVLYVYLKERLK